MVVRKARVSDWFHARPAVLFFSMNSTCWSFTPGSASTRAFFFFCQGSKAASFVFTVVHNVAVLLGRHGSHLQTQDPNRHPWRPSSGTSADSTSTGRWSSSRPCSIASWNRRWRDGSSQERLGKGHGSPQIRLVCRLQHRVHMLQPNIAYFGCTVVGFAQRRDSACDTKETERVSCSDGSGNKPQMAANVNDGNVHSLMVFVIINGDCDDHACATWLPFLAAWASVRSTTTSLQKNASFEKNQAQACVISRAVAGVPVRWRLFRTPLFERVIFFVHTARLDEGGDTITSLEVSNLL